MSCDWSAHGGAAGGGGAKGGDGPKGGGGDGDSTSASAGQLPL